MTSNHRKPEIVTKNILLKCITTQNSFNFAHINTGSLKPNIDEIRKLVKDANLHALAVSETWFHKGINSKLIKIDDMTIIRHDRSRNDVKRGGGIAIYYKSNLSAKIIAKSKSNAITEFLFVEFTNDVGKLAFGVVYNPPNKTLFDSLEKSLQTNIARYQDAIVVGDFNTNLIAQNSASKKCLEIFSKNGLTCASKIATNFTNPMNPSSIDLVFVKINEKLLRLTQFDPGSFTTHDFLIGTYEFKAKPMKLCKTFRDFNNVCAEKLIATALPLNWDLLYSLPSIDDQVNYVNSLINIVINSCVPLKKLKTKIPTSNFIDSNMQKIIDRRNFFWHSWRKEKNQLLKAELHLKFKSLRNQVNNALNNAKKRKLRKEFSFDLPPKTLWKNLKKHGVTSSNDSKDHNFTPTEFNNYFHSVFTQPNPMQTSMYCGNDPDLQKFAFQTVASIEVYNSIMSTKSNAIGFDGVPSCILKKLCPLIIPFLTYIVNNCITQSYFPAQWKIADILPHPKTSNPTMIEDFRPLSLLPAASKILERILENQIKQFVNENKLLSQFQSGFREKHSTTTAMLKVTDDISTSLEEKGAALLVLLDFKKAFDLVNHKILLNKLSSQFFFSNEALKMMASYLTDRHQRVKCDEQYSPLAKVSLGTPQGGILSALLFSLYINDLPNAVEVNIHLYADDSQLYCDGSCDNINEIVARMNLNLQKVSDWASENDVKINAEKSHAILFSKKSQQCTQIPLSLNSEQIKYVDKARSLGLILNAKFNWENHIQKITGEIYGTLSMLRASQNITSRNMRAHLVKSLIVPKILYCASIYSGCSNSEWQKLKVCFNNCVRYIYNLTQRDSVSNEVIKILQGTLNQFLDFHSCIQFYKILSGNAPSFVMHHHISPKKSAD